MSEKITPICDARNRPWMAATNADLNLIILFQPRCKRWSCAGCAEINKSAWAFRAEHGVRTLIRHETEANFLTLTSHERLSPEGTMKVWADAWKRLRQRAVEETEGKSEYLMIPEQHRDRRLHMHAIETAGLGRKWWKDNGRECGLGYMADEEEILGVGGAVYYVSKYIAKTLADSKWPDRWRRVRTSRRWPKLPDLSTPEGWTFEALPPRTVGTAEAERLDRLGWHVVLADHHSAWIALGSDEGEL